MLSLWITRWLLGYVRFSIKGGSPERFYTYCTRVGTYLWNMEGHKKGSACVLASRYHTLRACARRAGCTLRVTDRRGLPFLLVPLKKHSGIVAGAAVFAAILLLLSSRVWCVEISGNSTIPTPALESALHSAGLIPGSAKSQINPRLVGQQVMLKFPKIGWLSVNTDGCIANVTLREKTDRPEIENRTGICNIKASRTGQILSLHVYAGTAMVRKGDAVVEGQLLVSAIVEDKEGGSSLKHAAAEVYAETERTLSAEVPFRQQVQKPTGHTVTRMCLDLLGAQVPLTFERKPRGTYTVSAENTEIGLFGRLLPLGLYREEWTEQHTQNVVLTRSQARAQAEQKIREQERSTLGGAEILSSSPTETLRGTSLVLTMKLKCKENIAEESGILIKS